jgi:hypothetical protein
MTAELLEMTKRLLETEFSDWTVKQGPQQQLRR